MRAPRSGTTPHWVLAALVAPLAITVFVLARRSRLAAHKRLARWVLPLWLTVSVTRAWPECWNAPKCW